RFGFGSLAACSAGMLFMHADTPRWLLIVCLSGAGVGLGLIMPNLTVFIQELVGRSMLGISTAVMQSTRMVGGMIGTAVVGSIVAHFYVERVHALDVSPFGNATWMSRLEDPQVLVNAQVQSEFVGALQRVGLHGELFISHARESLVWAVHAGLTLTVLIALIGLVWLWRLPTIQLGADRSRDVVSSSSTKEASKPI